MRKYCYKYVLLIFMIFLTFIYTLAGCGTTPPSVRSVISVSSVTSDASNNSMLSNNGISPENTVKGFLDNIKAHDFDKASSYLNEDVSFVSYDTAEDEKFFKLFLSKIDYKIISSEVQNNFAAVKTKMTAPDLGKISDQAADDLVLKFEEALNDNTEGWGQTEEMIMESLISYLSKTNLPYKTTEIDFSLIKNDKRSKWVIEPDEDLLNALSGELPGFFEPENKRNDLKEDIEDGVKTKITKHETIIIENESTIYESTQIDEELKKELDDLFEKLGDMND